MDTDCAIAPFCFESAMPFTSLTIAIAAAAGVVTG
jgi:hypothetical protein